MAEEKKVLHPFAPVYNQDSRLLILGSFPSVRSRQVQFYYGHPQNRFWPLMERLYQVLPLTSIEEKKTFLFFNGIALFDVLESCVITGSSDASIRDAVPNCLDVILHESKIGHIFLNGKTAGALYAKYHAERMLPSHVLPSTSAANARYSLDDLAKIWDIIRKL